MSGIGHPTHSPVPHPGGGENIARGADRIEHAVRASVEVVHGDSGVVAGNTKKTDSPTIKEQEPYSPPPLRYVATHYQILGMHGYTRSDGTWVIGYLEEDPILVHEGRKYYADVAMEKIVDYPIPPNTEESEAIKRILSENGGSDGYVLCSPRTILKLLLEGTQLVEHSQNEDEVGYFRFKIDGLSIWLIAHRDYKDFPKYKKSDE